MNNLNFSQEFPRLFQRKWPRSALDKQICDIDIGDLCREYKQLVLDAPRREPATKPYIVGHNGIPTSTSGSNRREEHIAIALVNMRRQWPLPNGGWFHYIDYCEVILSDWFMRAIEANEVVTISHDYFRLRRPLERRIYEIGRKHCGSQKKWQIGLAKLQEKTGGNAPLKKFRLNMRQIIADDHTPFYRLELTKDDLVVFRPRTTTTTLAPDISLPDWAEEKARRISREKGWDYHALCSNWMDFARAETAKGNPPKNAGAAFVAYCKKQDKLR